MLKNIFFSITMYIFIAFVSLVIYFKQIQPDNEYTGLESFDLNICYFLYLFISIAVLSIFSNFKKKILPSDVFTIIFTIFIIIWSIIFYNVTNLLSFKLYLFLIIILFFPIVAIYFLNQWFLYIFNSLYIRINILRFIRIEYLLTLFLLLVFLIMISKISISFSFEESYIRRLSARDKIYGLLAYIFAMSMNSVAPYLSFYAFLKKKYMYFFVSLLYVFLCFGFIGVKAPILSVLILAFFGLYIRRFSNISLFKMLLVLVFSILSLSLLENIIFGHSIIADIFVRRAFLVLAQIETYFIDFMVKNFSLENWFFGYNAEKSMPFLIGEIYFNNVNTNANTNAILYELSKNGLFGYLCLVICISLFFSFLNYLYIKFQFIETFGIAFIYSLLLTEQAYTTAFATSGVAFLALLIFMTMNKKE